VHTAEDNQDHLFLMTDLAYAPDAAWLQPALPASPAPATPPAPPRIWTSSPYDDTGNPESNLSLAYVSLTLYQDTDNAPYLIAGVNGPQGIINYLVLLPPVNPSNATSAWQRYGT